MVAGKNHSSGLGDGNPACGLQGLSRFINEKRGEFHAVEHAAGSAGQSACDDPCLCKKVVVDAKFKFGGSAAQSVHLLVIGLG